MKLKSLKTECFVLVFLFLLAGLQSTVQAAITNPASCPATLPSWTVNRAGYSYTFTGTNGNGTSPYWVVTAGTFRRD